MGNKLVGNIYGHPKFEDGSFIITSEIVHMNGEIATTRNSKYVLMNPFIYTEKKDL